MTLIHILATRPNFIKAAPVIKALDLNGYENYIINTNQHYDYNMSKLFFKELDIPEPNRHLGVRSGTHAEQTGNALIKIEEVLLEKKSQERVVYGDVNSTLSGALASAKLNIPIFHIESGCRSFDKKMPEEINRIIIDNISDLLFCTEQSACNNLTNEGFASEKIKLVGNTSIDTLHKLSASSPIINEDYFLCTLHRPFNVDEKYKLNKILNKLNSLDKIVLLPSHPRLQNNLTGSYDNIKFINPLGYVDFINYLQHSKGAITDSGGVQCEASFLNVPLLTLRPSTEHLSTLKRGNSLIDINEDFIFSKRELSDIPFIWDGNASDRIVDEIDKYYA